MLKWVRHLIIAFKLSKHDSNSVLLFRSINNDNPKIGYFLLISLFMKTFMRKFMNHNEQIIIIK